MSGFYTANQFDHAFKPIILGNYQYGTNPWPGRFAMCSPTKPKNADNSFIANDCGHLLPSISRNACTSPWGDYAMSIWEQTAPCQCINLLRNPENFEACEQLICGKVCCLPKPKKIRIRKIPKKNMPSCGCDPCTGLPLTQPYIYGRPTMMGDPKTINKQMRDQRRADNMVARANRRGPCKGPAPGSQAVTVRLQVNPGYDGPSRHGCI